MIAPTHSSEAGKYVLTYTVTPSAYLNILGTYEQTFSIVIRNCVNEFDAIIDETTFVYVIGETASRDLFVAEPSIDPACPHTLDVIITLDPNIVDSFTFGYDQSTKQLWFHTIDTSLALGDYSITINVTANSTDSD